MIDDSLSDVQQLTQSKGYQDALKEGMKAVINAQQEKKMSVKELMISDAPIYFKFTKADNIEGAIKIKAYFGKDCPRAEAVIDRSQAHLLMLYLQEHLK